MSLLWRNKKNKKLLTILYRPSPKRIMFCSSLARGIQLLLFKIRDSIKGTSLLIFLKKNMKAGMTVEASLVLPMFLFFFVTLGSAMEMIRLHGNMQLALWNTGRKLSVYEYALSSGEESALWQEIKDGAVAYTYVKAELVDYLGEQYLERAPIASGADGLQFWESELFTDDGRMEVIVTWQADVIPFRMANRYYGHAWNGYDIANAKQLQRDLVYVAENGEVYHEQRDCTHLTLSVKGTSMEEALTSKNLYGSRYIACDKCVIGAIGEEVYITDEGDCYHFDRYCPGLKRTVFEMERKHAEKYRPCSRCVSEKD